MKDIQTTQDIEILVHQFYGKVRADALLAPVFSAVITGSWDAHLQKMCDFWGTILLYTRKYSSDPMPKHLRLPVEPAHFERWLHLFNETVDAHFKGDTASMAKTRAKSIATLMQIMKGHNNATSIPTQTT